MKNSNNKKKVVVRVVGFLLPQHWISLQQNAQLKWFFFQLQNLHNITHFSFQMWKNSIWVKPNDSAQLAKKAYELLWHCRGEKKDCKDANGKRGSRGCYLWYGLHFYFISWYRRTCYSRYFPFLYQFFVHWVICWIMPYM